MLASLAETFPGLEWERQATWFWQRVVQHGRRRAEEMREAAVTVADAGIAPRMATATAEVQSWIAMLRRDGVFAAVATDHRLARGWPTASSETANRSATPVSRLVAVTAH